MVGSEYVPDIGHVVWIDLDPQAGREQRGQRPALVLSAASYNAKTSLALICPITTRVKSYPFEVALGGGADLAGVVLSDQVKSLDWRHRNARYKAAVSAEILERVRAKLRALLGL